MARSLIWRKDFPIEIFSALTTFATILSFMFVCVTLIRHWKDVSAEQKIFCFVILLGEVSNALICGALSGPHERYQARLTWLIPVVALLLCYERWLCSQNAGFDFRRQNMKPIPANPISSIADVEGSGTAGV